MYPHRVYEFALGVIWYIDRFQWLLALPAMLGLYFFGATGNGTAFLAAKLMIIDFISGMAKGAFWNALSSRVAYHGLQRKVAMAIVIALAHVADQGIGTSDHFKGVVATYVCGVECISILENVAATGLVVPEKLKVLLGGLVSSGEPPKKGA